MRISTTPRSTEPENPATRSRDLATAVFSHAETSPAEHHSRHTRIRQNKPKQANADFLDSLIALDLGLYVHLHRLVTDAFEELGADVRFLPVATPTPVRLTAVLAQVHKVVAAVAEDDAGPGSRLVTRPARLKAMATRWSR